MERQITISVIYHHDIKITVPKFYKSILQDEYIAIMDDDNVVCTYEGPTFNNVEHGTTNAFKHRIERAYNNWTEITEQEFMDHYENYLQTLSLKPQLIEKPEHPGNEIIKNSIK